ncbi:MAG TPA: methyltransferase domain-containing protein, partial [Vicinamibacteria bacterium]|nr:methyltransferase domain-containing protein [Vicinamibacteria bacterium]
RLFALALEGRAAHRADTGFNAPVIYHAMGEGNLACAPGGDLEAYAPVRTSHSNCVLPLSLDRPRALVQDFYGRAAEQPQAGLCCPVSYDREDIAHIPQDVIDRFSGCGGPLSLAGVQPGETVVDLGSGAGIDVFIAARKVGPTGRAIGVDMTDPMLGVAGQNKEKVGQALGYDVVDFRKGYLEDVPVEDASVDLVTSNCVINLSPDKPRVLREMWRVLRDHGRIVVSDIVADGLLPPGLKVNVHLWGECISGALPEDEFVAELEKAGFYGVALLKKEFWKELEGHNFFSVTVRGYKFQKKAGCVFLGHRAVYLGPYVSVGDEEGHLFPVARRWRSARTPSPSSHTRRTRARLRSSSRGSTCPRPSPPPAGRAAAERSQEWPSRSTPAASVSNGCAAPSGTRTSRPSRSRCASACTARSSSSTASSRTRRCRRRSTT